MSAIERTGSGPPLVLIHGSPGNAQSWKGVVARLKDRFTVILPTLPGHGDDFDSRPTETAALAAGVVESIGPLAGPVVLAGHSYGGNVALHIALSGRLAIERMVLFEPVALNVLAATGHGAEHAAAKTLFDEYVSKVAAGDPEAIGMMVDYWFGEGAFGRMPQPMRNYLAARAPVNARDVAATFREHYSALALHALAMPVTVAYGTASPAIARVLAEAIAKAVGLGFTLAIKGGTHAMLVSNAEAVANAIATDVIAAEG